MAKVESEAVYLVDADRIEKLLDIIMNTVEMPNVPCIRQAAYNELGAIEADLWAQMHPQEAEAQKQAQKEREKAEAERQEQLKKAQQEEYKKSQEGRELEKEDA